MDMADLPAAPYSRRSATKQFRLCIATEFIVRASRLACFRYSVAEVELECGRQSVRTATIVDAAGVLGGP